MHLDKANSDTLESLQLRGKLRTSQGLPVRWNKNQRKLEQSLVFSQCTLNCLASDSLTCPINFVQLVSAHISGWKQCIDCALSVSVCLSVCLSVSDPLSLSHSLISLCLSVSVSLFLCLSHSLCVYDVNNLSAILSKKQNKAETRHNTVTYFQWQHFPTKKILSSSL